MPSAYLPKNRVQQEIAVADAGAFREIDPDVIRLLYDVDECPPDFLPYLAWLLSVDFWELATTDEQRRDLIRGAIQWHLKRGTPWAVKAALAAFGYPVRELVEYSGYRDSWAQAGGYVLDGTWSLDGTVSFAAPVVNGRPLRLLGLGHWTHFAVRLDVPESMDWTQTHQRKIRAVAESYAPERSKLVTLIAGMTVQFVATPVMRVRSLTARSVLICCDRFQPLQRLTLSGCWSLTEQYEPLLLDGTWVINGQHRISGTRVTGRPLDSGHLSIRARLKQREHFSSGGDRQVGWVLLDGQRQLDSTWALSDRRAGPDGGWFTATARTTRNGVTTEELL